MIDVIKYGADWCKYCRIYERNFQYIRKKMEGDTIRFLEVDTDEEPDKAKAFGVVTLPTTIILRDNNVIFKHEGAMTTKQLGDLIYEALV